MLIAIVLILIGAASGSAALVPERYQRRYLWTISGLTIAFGIMNLITQERGSSQLLGRIDRYGTALNLQASEATLQVEGPATKRQATYSLALKIIPRSHERARHLNPRLRPAHSYVEPDYIDDITARQLYWIMQDSTSTVLIDEERKSGIDTYYFFGAFDPQRNLVRMQPNPAMYLPSIYPSLRDLEDKYIVARIASSGVEHPMFTELRLSFD